MQNCDTINAGIFEHQPNSHFEISRARMFLLYHMLLREPANFSLTKARLMAQTAKTAWRNKDRLVYTPASKTCLRWPTTGVVLGFLAWPYRRTSPPTCIESLISSQVQDTSPERSELRLDEVLTDSLDRDMKVERPKQMQQCEKLPLMLGNCSLASTDTTVFSETI